MVSHGMRVEDGSIYCGEVKQSDSAIARSAKVDRRVVKATIEAIENDPALIRLFSKLRPMLLLADVAPEIGCTTLDIIPIDASMPGILAEITNVVYKAHLSVMQAVVEASGNYKGAHLIIVIDGEIPDSLLPKIRQCKGVSSVILR